MSEAAMIAAEQAEEREPEPLPPRPRTYGECPKSGPCPWVGCRHHAYLEIQASRRDRLRVNFPGMDPLDIDHPCTLRVAEGPAWTGSDAIHMGHRDVGVVMGVTREYARQLELMAVGKIKRLLDILRALAAPRGIGGILSRVGGEEDRRTKTGDAQLDQLVKLGAVQAITRMRKHLTEGRLMTWTAYVLTKEGAGYVRAIEAMLGNATTTGE